jgi:hypothetical protein
MVERGDVEVASGGQARILSEHRSVVGPVEQGLLLGRDACSQRLRELRGDPPVGVRFARRRHRRPRQRDARSELVPPLRSPNGRPQQQVGVRGGLGPGEGVLHDPNGIPWAACTFCTS